jgi:predicted amidohydrolase
MKMKIGIVQMPTSMDKAKNIATAKLGIEECAKTVQI